MSLVITAATGRGGRFALWLKLLRLPTIDRKKLLHDRILNGCLWQGIVEKIILRIPAQSYGEKTEMLNFMNAR